MVCSMFRSEELLKQCPGRAKLGETHPDTLQSKHDLAKVLQAVKNGLVSGFGVYRDV